jgi:hypothetical protein
MNYQYKNKLLYFLIVNTIKFKMTKVNCIICGTSFPNASSFKNHLHSYKKCQHRYILVNRKYYRDNYNDVNNLFLNKISDIKSNNQKKTGCHHCGALVNDNTYIYKHFKICKVLDYKQEHDIINNNIIKKTLNQINNQMSNSHNNNNNNNINNIHNGDVINNNIIIKNFSSEYDDEILEKIPKSIKKQILKSPASAIVDLFKLIHIDMPEHRNFHVNNLKDGYAQVHKDGEWEPMAMNKALTEAVSINSDRLYDIANDDSIKIKKIYLKQISEILDEISENTKLTSQYRRSIKTITYKFRELIDNTKKPKKLYELKLKKQ